MLSCREQVNASNFKPISTKPVFINFFITLQAVRPVDIHSMHWQGLLYFESIKQQSQSTQALSFS